MRNTLVMLFLMCGLTSCSSADAYRNELLTQRVNFTTMTNVFKDTWVVEPKMVEEVLETNSWASAISNHERGLYRPYEFMVYSDTASICWTNISGIQATDTIYWGGGILGKCPEEHVKDYPVSSDTEYGVQWRKEYETVVKVDDNTMTNRFIKYTYPHKKITHHRVVKLTKSVTVTTNTVNIVEKMISVRVPEEPER